ncbi:MAG: deoxynucleoside kinase [Flavobacteriales bacterium]
MLSPYRYISIEVNIGAGKTSLSTRIANDWGARLVLEEFAENPFLPKFYEQPERYAFPLELSFLSERFSQLKRELNTSDLFAPIIISDYFISKCQIFAKNNLQGDEYHLFMKMFELVEASCPKPDLLVYLYLDVAELQANIRKRGRTYEAHITDAYLENIQRQYMEFIRQHQDMRVVIINTQGLDFVSHEADYLKLKTLIQREYPIGITRISDLS